MKYWLIVLIAVSMVSCGTKEEKKDLTDEGDQVEIKQGKNNVEPDSKEVDLDADHKVVEEKTLENGISIKWFAHGSGEKLKDGDMVDIDYKVYLENREVIDGNHLRNLESFPFMVGFQMQTKSWDMALRELQIGDFVEVFIPAGEMRGDKAVDGLIPKNSNNILKIRVLGFNEPTKVVDGTRIWLINENKSMTNLFDDGKRISFHCWVSSQSNPLYFNTEWENNPYNFGLGDGGLVPGLRKALINAKKADLMLVHVPADEAYGSKGYQELVKPNEDLLYRVFVMEVRDK